MRESQARRPEVRRRALANHRPFQPSCMPEEAPTIWRDEKKPSRWGWQGRPLEEMVYVLIGTLVLLLAALAIFWNWKQAQQTQLLAQHTREATGTIRRLILVVQQAEAGQRGYQLMLDGNYLDPYQKAMAELPKVLEALRGISKADARLAERVDEIINLAEQRMDELTSIVQLTQMGASEAAQLITRTHLGKQSMDQLQKKVMELDQEVVLEEARLGKEMTANIRLTALLALSCCVGLFVLFAFENQRVIARRRAAEQASHLKSTFLASISHELRTPLNAIIGYSQMLQEEANPADKRDLLKIEGAGKHLLQIINSILDLSKIEAGKLEIRPVGFAVKSLLEEVEGLVRPLAQNNNNSFQLQMEGDLGRMQSDGFRIKQCLLNLAGNACKFTRDGSIVITATREEREGSSWLTFAVSDTGPGISAEDLKLLFEPFQQLRPEDGGKTEGTGLGLAITHRLCQMLGGQVKVRSTLGAGSTFTMHLPAEVPAKLPD